MRVASVIFAGALVLMSAKACHAAARSSCELNQATADYRGDPDLPNDDPIRLGGGAQTAGEPDQPNGRAIRWLSELSGDPDGPDSRAEDGLWAVLTVLRAIVIKG